MSREVGNLQRIKKLNRIGILNIIREHNTISRQQLATLTGLTPAAISGIVRDLVASGYVKEIGLGKSSGGRRPVKLQFNPDCGFILGAEITREKTTLGIVNLQAKPLLIKQYPIDMTEPRDGLTALAKEVKNVIIESEIDENKILGMGIACPGLFDVTTRVVKRSPNLGEKWRDIPIEAWLRDMLGMRIFVENNSNAAALAEYSFGKGKEIDNMVYVNLGEGISAGIILNGKLVYGFKGYSGEVGHFVVTEDGPLCNCGNNGCLESVYAVPALVRKANNELPLCDENEPLKMLWKDKGEVTVEDLILYANHVDSYAWKLFRQAGWYIGIGIAAIINFYNPAAVFIGGILAGAGATLLEPLLESVQRHAFPELAKEVRIELSAMHRDTGFYGACVVAIRALFEGGVDALLKF
ncbi:ROK family transcriptional regulator [Neomoorella thermoacetica]|uniref:ROK family transcriptional regulator n=1 Tax=Neomoorella thermoacetica TaxID=1525 RepID=UPI0008FB8C3A|nr:ROK family transcriptional regulator [Moorella thermoacetica]APC07504.1 N-acetylglucosamine repressor [Moorella thermoacetica]